MGPVGTEWVETPWGEVSEKEAGNTRRDELGDTRLDISDTMSEEVRLEFALGIRQASNSARDTPLFFLFLCHQNCPLSASR